MKKLSICAGILVLASFAFGQSSAGVALNTFTVSSGSTSASADGFGLGGYYDYQFSEYGSVRGGLDIYSNNGGTITMISVAVPFRASFGDFGIYAGPVLASSSLSGSGSSISESGIGLILGFDWWATKTIGVYWDGLAHSINGGSLGFGHIGAKFRF